MEDLARRLKQLREIPFPPGLHTQILQRVVLERFRASVIAGVLFAMLNGLFSGWLVTRKVIKLELHTLVRVLIQDGEFTWSVLKENAQTLWEAASTSLLVSLSHFFVSLIVIIVLLHILGRLRLALSTSSPQA